MGADPGVLAVADAMTHKVWWMVGMAGTGLPKCASSSSSWSLRAPQHHALRSWRILQITAGAVAWGHCWGRWERSARLSGRSRAVHRLRLASYHRINTFILRMASFQIPARLA